MVFRKESASREGEKMHPEQDLNVIAARKEREEEIGSQQ